MVAKLYQHVGNSLDVSSREPGWQERLIYLVDEELAKPFNWVNASCIDLMRASVEACYGPHHPALTTMPTYSTDEEAIAALASAGGLIKAVNTYFGTVPYLHAFTGDIAIVRGADEGVAGTIVLDGMLVGKATDNVVFRLPISSAFAVFRV